VKVEIWSDVVCPWCYIGKRRFEAGLARFEDAADVEVEWRSFQLNPDQPRGVQEPLDRHLATKMGGTVEQAQAMNERVSALAAEEGLDYHLDRYRVINTIDAHRVLHLAKTRGLGGVAHERLLRAQLVEGELLEDPDTLARLGTAIGLDETEVRDMLASGAMTDAVEGDFEVARRLGINAVPFFVFDRLYGVAGAQPADTFLEVLRRVRDETAAAADA
jgi:predicted DsbA family dithiol-disulfide isomerase